MSRAEDDRGRPRAVIHKRILDVAESRPDASLEVIAGEVGGATPDLVERVLEEYGDPAGDPTDATHPHQPDMTTNGEVPSDVAESTGRETPAPDALPARVSETLRLVHDHPGWSQADVAETLDVSRATVSRRLNDIPGFDWQDREAFTRQVFDEEPGAAGGEAPRDGGEDDTAEGSQTDDRPTIEDDPATDGRAGARDASGERLDAFEERLAALEARVDGPGADGAPVGLPPELAHKVVHACLRSDRISEDEELQLLEALLAE